ncbi:hypothetical protein [Streptomyces mirabilis]|uniref:hypothetical protein n=1 Tax=Streptomyces mirabilis TaxID=68239 RepID=UPI00324C631C
MAKQHRRKATGSTAEATQPPRAYLHLRSPSALPRRPTPGGLIPAPRTARGGLVMNPWSVPAPTPQPAGPSTPRPATRRPSNPPAWWEEQRSSGWPGLGTSTAAADGTSLHVSS